MQKFRHSLDRANLQEMKIYFYSNAMQCNGSTRNQPLLERQIEQQIFSTQTGPFWVSYGVPFGVSFGVYFGVPWG